MPMLFVVKYNMKSKCVAEITYFSNFITRNLTVVKFNMLCMFIQQEFDYNLVLTNINFPVDPVCSHNFSVTDIYSNHQSRKAFPSPLHFSCNSDLLLFQSQVAQSNVLHWD